MGEVADKAQHAGHEAQDSDWLDWAIRIGLVAYGIVHLMVAWLAVQLAFGSTSENASNQGALHALAQQPMGGVLIWMIAVGMLLLVVWRVLEFAVGHREETDDAKRWRKRAGSLGKAVIYGVLAWSAFKVATGSGQRRFVAFRPGPSVGAAVEQQPDGLWIAVGRRHHQRGLASRCLWC